jgi:preprotein translocase subunit SecD
MDRGWYGRLILVVGVLGLAVWLLYPSYYFFTEATAEEKADHTKFCEALPGWASCTKFNLGLDLQGGVHLVMGVQSQKAVEQAADRSSESLREALGEEGLAFTRIERPRDTAEIVVSLAPETDADAFEKYLRKDFRDLATTKRVDRTYTIEFTEDVAENIRNSAVDQAIKTIRNRADKLGVTEPTIARRGGDNILIQLPGVEDPDRALDIIGRTAQLEFKIADEEATARFDEIQDEELPAGVVKQTTQFEGPGGRSIREVYFEVPDGKTDAMVALLTPKIAGNREIAFEEMPPDPNTPGIKRWRSYVLDSHPGITGDYLSNARVQQNPDLPTDYHVVMTFDAKGGKLFDKLTGDNVRRHMAIVLDGKVNSAPIIEERIGGGSARIMLGGAGDARSKFQEARDLTLVLKAGALPAPVEIREKRQVGRSLGDDAVKKGSTAIAVGGLLVILFMLIYYRGSGLLADLALVLNVFLVMAVLAMFEATLTLPGMAGILLTIGMAVDANVIIFERVREELRIGKTPRAAVESGYGKAFRTIFDANVTTLIAGVVLMQYGTGPIRGFAVTLIVGILCSMFTAIVVTRLIFDFFTGRRRLRSLSI